jgi:hypothetical protein
MAAPIYSQEQVQRMLLVPKIVSHDEWENRFAGRQSPDEQRDRIKASPADADDLTEFWIEICRCAVRSEASFTMAAKLLEYPEHALCRYEVQLGSHTNPKWFTPHFVDRRALHKHIYNERAIREGFTWDKCAEPVKQPKRKLSFQQAIDHLTPIFLEELRIEIHDPNVRGLFHHGR